MRDLKFYLAQLNEEQLTAVTSVNNKILCIAPAGSGKTKVLTTRVFKLLNTRVGPQSILCLTFTRLAGLEMKERLIKMTTLSKKVFSNTFHAFCVEILRKYADRIGFTKDFTIADEDKRKEMLMESAKIYKYTKNIDNIIKVISNYYNKTNVDSKITEVINDYIYNTRKYDVIDLDMLMYYTYCLLKDNEDIRAYYKAKYTHILVDEVQDTSKVQIAIIEQINPKNLFIVGDPNQSIYGWRYADMNYILNFGNVYPESLTVTLKYNYRSTIPIIKAANNLIKNNSDTKDITKDMISGKAGEEICIIEMDTEKKQNERVVSEILGIEKYNYGDITILARSNKELSSISDVLTSYDIPNISPQNNNNFTKNITIKNVINVVEAAINHRDDKAMIKALNYPNTILTAEQLIKVKKRCIDLNISIWDCLNKFNFSSHDEINKFIDNINRLTTQIYESGLALQIIAYAIKLFNINSDAELLNKLLEDVEEWTISQNRYSLPTNISTYLDYFKSKDIQDKLKVKSTEENKVKLLTIHSSKGLEFKVVFLIGMCEGSFPYNDTDILESRRLAYVGITRACEVLILTSYKEKRDFKKNKIFVPVSRFINELKEGA
jgi:DNA helicase-2/ATP-dependent DNA helicase PcrA